MKNLLSARSLRAVSAAGIAAASLTTAFALAGSFNGAIYTTDSAGAAVNQNTFNGAGTVYINGGPNNTNASGLPANDVFYFEVTDPSGKILLSKDAAACRQVRTNSSGRIDGVEVDGTCLTGSHTLGTPDLFGGQPVKLAPFEQTPNTGGEYKVILVRKNAPGVSVEPDGRHLDYPRAAAKSDNFKVLNYNGDGGWPGGSNGGGGTTGGGGGCCDTE